MELTLQEYIPTCFRDILPKVLLKLYAQLVKKRLSFQALLHIYENENLYGILFFSKVFSTTLLLSIKPFLYEFYTAVSQSQLICDSL